MNALGVLVLRPAIGTSEIRQLSSTSYGSPTRQNGPSAVVWKSAPPTRKKYEPARRWTGCLEMTGNAISGCVRRVGGIAVDGIARTAGLANTLDQGASVCIREVDPGTWRPAGAMAIACRSRWQGAGLLANSGSCAARRGRTLGSRRDGAK